MLDNCELCEEQDTGVIYVNGLTMCYECATLTNDNELGEDLDTEEEEL